MTRITSSIALTLLTACFGAIDAPESDAATVARVQGVRVVDRAGAEQPSDAAPGDAQFLIDSTDAIAPMGVYLILGEIDDGALRARALAASTRRRLVGARIELRDGGLRLVPDTRLMPGERYTLLVSREASSAGGAELEGTPLALSVNVARPPPFGVRESFPADGTAAVPRELAQILVALEGASPERIALDGPRGPVAVGSAAISCEEAGFDAEACIAIAPRVPLVEGHHRLSIARGEEQTIELAFDVANDARAPLAVRHLACAPDEMVTTLGCVLATDERLVVRAAVDRPVRAFLEANGERVARGVWSRGEGELRLERLVAGAEHPAALCLIALDGRETRLEATLSTRGPLAPLFITRVVSNPVGSEPTQEVIELFHAGADWLSLEGMSIVDDPLRSADGLAVDAVVPPRGFALLVPDDFDAALASDVAPGAVLVRAGRALTPGGLRNRGERVLLRDRDGARLSEAPAIAHPEGGCVERTSGGGRDGDPASFAARERCDIGVGAWLEAGVPGRGASQSEASP